MSEHRAHSDYAAYGLLKDGGSIRIRAIHAEDKERLLEHFQGLSGKSIYQRFFTPKRELTPSDLTLLTELDFEERVALVATLFVDERERIVGVGRFAITDRQRREAEVAFAVSDAHQGRGIGTLLLEHLAIIARDLGISAFEADVLQENAMMLSVFRDSGYEVARRSDAGVVHVSFAIEDSERVRAANAEREQAASRESLRAILAPRSVALVGASRREGSIGGRILTNLREARFAGPLYVVHPSAKEIDGMTAHPTLSAIGQPIDLAIISVPAAEVESVVRDAAAAHVRGLVVISSGFAEASTEGRTVERQLLDEVRSSGMRMVGPNCMGVLNTDPAVRLNATFAPVPPTAGNVGMLSQSGALGLALLDYARAYGFGVSAFVSAGNKADVSGNDLLSYWADDPATQVIALYLESFGNPRRFGRLAPKVARKKPIVALKSGRSTAGRRAAASHSAALASPDSAVDALFEQAGIIRAETMEELLETLDLLAAVPSEAGERIGVVTNAGGPAILFADACESSGLSIPELDDDLRRSLAAYLPAQASVGNPVDMIAAATPSDYERTIEIVGNAPNVDAVAAIYVPPFRTSAEEIASAIARGAGRVPRSKPVITIFVSSSRAPKELRSGPRGALPSYAFPENGARALAAAARYARWRARPVGSALVLPDHRRARIRECIEAALSSPTRVQGAWLDQESASALLSAAGIPLVQSELTSPKEALERAAKLGFPVVLKGIVAGVVHKSDLGLVALHLGSEQDVARACERMKTTAERSGAMLRGVQIQREVIGLEMIAGVTQDPTFGPLVVAGMGGVQAELLRDVAFRLTPVTDRDAMEMLGSLRMKAALDGYRGSPRRDVRAFVEVLMRLSALVDLAPEIAELDLNPVMVLAEGEGAIAVDARVRLG
jgi:acetyl coenzyme A synthetase (ADP forming)-like protein